MRISGAATIPKACVEAINRRFRACVMECGGNPEGFRETPLSMSWRLSNLARKSASLLIVLFALTASAEPSAPVGLLVNGVKNPLATERDATRFTWMSKDTERGESQSALQNMVFQDD